MVAGKGRTHRQNAHVRSADLDGDVGLVAQTVFWREVPQPGGVEDQNSVLLRHGYMAGGTVGLGGIALSGGVKPVPAFVVADDAVDLLTVVLLHVVLPEGQVVGLLPLIEAGAEVQLHGDVLDAGGMAVFVKALHPDTGVLPIPAPDLKD